MTTVTDAERLLGKARNLLSWALLVTQDHEGSHATLAQVRDEIDAHLSSPSSPSQTSLPECDELARKQIAANDFPLSKWIALARSLESRCVRQQERIAGLEKDADRYRWLRDSHNQGANSPTGEGLVVVTDRPLKEPRYIGPLAWQLLDAAVDAARSEGAK